MPAIHVRPCTITELQAAPNWAELLAEYACESSLPELGPACAQMDTYLKLESTGMLRPIAAFDGERLAGFILLMVVVLPHYGVLTATVESFFVPLADRKHGLGLQLLTQAEALAKDLGAKAVFISAPAGSLLGRVLGHLKPYRHSNEVFVKALA